MYPCFWVQYVQGRDNVSRAWEPELYQAGGWHDEERWYPAPLKISSWRPWLNLINLIRGRRMRIRDLTCTWNQKYITDKAIEIWELCTATKPPFKWVTWIKIFTGKQEVLFKLVNLQAVLLLIPCGEVDLLWWANRRSNRGCTPCCGQSGATFQP